MILGAESSSSNGAGLVGFSLFLLAFWVLMAIAYWRIFTKIGLPGWMGIVPFVNVYMLFKARGQRSPILWLILLLIPCIGIIAFWFLCSDTAELFGKGVGWKLVLFLLPGIGHLVLGLSDTPADPAAISPDIRRA